MYDYITPQKPINALQFLKGNNSLLSMQTMLEQGPDFWCWFDTTQFSYIPLCSPNTCKYVFNPNVTTFQSNCGEGLHFSAFIIIIINIIIYVLNFIYFCSAFFYCTY